MVSFFKFFGKDISALAYSWKRHLDNTIIICPDGHEMCSINPSGRQWFDLSRDDPDYILEQARLAEKKVSYFLNEIKNFFKFENKNICLAGFSQGCMISLNLAFGSNEEFNSVIGFSGKIIDKNYLSKNYKNIKIKTIDSKLYSTTKEYSQKLIYAVKEEKFDVIEIHNRPIMINEFVDKILPEIS